MASASYMDDLTCSVCLCVFTDPVSLSCGHSFCRTCATSCLASQRVCPLRCDVITPADGGLPTNYTLKNLADKASEDAEKESNWVCSEHEEKLKLFCETDRQLVCVICRDGAKHDGHKFKPIKEAAQSKREELAKDLELIIGEISAVENLTETQEGEMVRTRLRSQQLKTQISSQFEEMHQFLRKREEEMKKVLEQKEEKALKEMQENLESMKEVFSKAREKEKMMRTDADIPEPEAFLQWWTEKMSAPPPQSSGANLEVMALKVVADSVSIDPYESHLQFFVWKEMLQVIKPLPDQLTLHTVNECLTVANGGRSMFCTPETFSNNYPSSGLKSPVQTTSSSQFSSGQPDHVLSDKLSSGQHYWEVEVEKGVLWEIGVRNNSNQTVALRYDGTGYSIRQGSLSPLSSEVTETPRKIGVFFSFSTSELSFYNADHMKLIHTTCDKTTSVTPEWLDHEQEFLDQEEEFLDQEEEFLDQGEEFLDQGEEFWDRGEEWSDQGEEFWDRGEEFWDRGEEFWDQGEEYLDQGEE